MSHDAPTRAIGNDALLLALAQHYRETWRAYEALDGAVLQVKKSESAAETIRRAEAALGQRADRLLAAICCIPADGLAGALAQLEAGFICADRAMATTGDEASDELYRWATWSIARVLRGLTGQPDTLVENLLPDIDPFELDAATIIERSDSLADRWATDAGAQR